MKMKSQLLANVKLCLPLALLLLVPAFHGLSADCVSPPAGLVAWWPGEGSANDIAGTNIGTLVNGGTFAAGEVGQAFRLDGISQCIEIPYSPSLANPNYSVEAWVKPMSQVTNAMHQNVLFGQSYGQCLLLARTGTSGVQTAFGFGVTPYDFFWAVSTTDIPIGQFSHVAGTWDGTHLRLYINGVLNSQITPGALWTRVGRFGLVGPLRVCLKIP